VRVNHGPENRAIEGEICQKQNHNNKMVCITGYVLTECSRRSRVLYANLYVPGGPNSPPFFKNPPYYPTFSNSSEIRTLFVSGPTWRDPGSWFACMCPT
jgi:hypothetical protein